MIIEITMENFTLTPIGFIRSSTIKAKYELPSQPSLSVREDIFTIQLASNQNYEQALEGLSGFSHAWILFWFHEVNNWKPKVLPPRSTRQKIGVFATRSPHRPNPIGLSVVKILSIEKLTITIASGDFLDGTPVLDIKPYLSYSESHPEATLGWLEPIIQKESGFSTVAYQVNFLPKIIQQLEWILENGVDIQTLIENRLSTDPFPHPYKRIKRINETEYILSIRQWRVQYTISDHIVTVEKLFVEFQVDEATPMIIREFSKKFTS